MESAVRKTTGWNLRLLVQNLTPPQQTIVLNSRLPAQQNGVGVNAMLHGHETEFLQAPESFTLADFGTAYEKIGALSSFPADKGSLYTLGAAVLIPALPVILAEIPLAVVLQDLFKALR
jgi:hypothetical protein